MRVFAISVLFLFMVSAGSCRKDGLITSADATLSISADTLRFDTVFTEAGSVTRFFTIRNTNRQRLRLDEVRLAGGNTSAFRINVNGNPSSTVRDIEMDAEDSLYVFVNVRIDPAALSQPFVVRDSLYISYNGNERWVQLEAYGQNAIYIRNGIIDANTTFTDELPYVILGPLRVTQNHTLTLEAGCRMYFNADAPLLVEGRLVTEGTAADSVVLRGNRLDEEYRDLPAAWPGLIFTQGSTGNQLTATYILNAYQGIIIEGNGGQSAGADLELNACVIDNCFETGLLAYAAHVEANNCLFTNSKINAQLVLGGNYRFQHCTMAAYANNFISHTEPVLIATNWDSLPGQLLVNDLRLLVNNTIIWGDEGVDDEFFLSRRGNTVFDTRIEHSLVKWSTAPSSVTLLNVLENQDPLFDSVNTVTRYYDFRIDRKGSPAVNFGLAPGLASDLSGRPRDGQPDAGCYEKQ